MTFLPKIIHYEDKFFKAYTLIYNFKGGICGGGIRFTTKFDENLLFKLAKNMALKYSLFDINCGGAKTIIIPKNKNRNKLKKFIKKHLYYLNNKIYPFIYFPGMDVGVFAEDLPFNYDSDATKFTAEGIYLITDFLNLTKNKTIILDGTGKIGVHILKKLLKNKCSVVGIGNKQVKLGGNFSKNELKKLLIDIIKYGDLGLVKFNVDTKYIYKRDNLFSIKSDVLISASIDYSITIKDLNTLKPRFIISATNFPFENGAQAKFESKGGFYIPSYISSSGAVFYNHYKKYLLLDVLLKPFFKYKLLQILKQYLKRKILPKVLLRQNYSKRLSLSLIIKFKLILLRLIYKVN